jgi:hypothetical protein
VDRRNGPTPVVVNIQGWDRGTIARLAFVSLAKNSGLKVSPVMADLTLFVRGIGSLLSRSLGKLVERVHLAQCHELSRTIFLLI